MSNKEFQGYTVEFDDDPSYDPEHVEYLVYNADDNQVGSIHRWFNTIDTYSVQYGGTTYRRSSTSEWHFEFLEPSCFDTNEFIVAYRQEFEASEFKTYRSAFKAFVNMGWLHYGFDRISTKTVDDEAEPDHSEAEVDDDPTWSVEAHYNDLEAIRERFESEGLDFDSLLQDSRYQWTMIGDSRYQFSTSPQAILHEIDEHRTLKECPHPECNSHSRSPTLFTRVVVEGGEDYCMDVFCSWTENQGEHFAKASEVCVICNRLFSKHNGSEALECLESLTIEGLNQGEHDDTTPYTVDDSTGWLS